MLMFDNNFKQAKRNLHIVAQNNAKTSKRKMDLDYGMAAGMISRS